MCVYIYTHTHTYIYIHTYIHTYICIGKVMHILFGSSFCVLNFMLPACKQNVPWLLAPREGWAGLV